MSEGVYLYNEKGEIISKITPADLDLDKKVLDYKLNISTWFQENGEYYIQFYEIPGFYNYNPKKNLWQKAELADKQLSGKDIFFQEKRIFIDSLGNKLIQLMTGTGIEARIVNLKGDESASLETNSYKFSTVASRDLSKELVLEASGTLYHLYFENKPIKTFLTDKSFRGLLQINDKEILAATELSGWYLINLGTKTSKKYDLTLNGNNYLPTLNRAIFKTKKGYWSNYDKGIIYVDETNRTISSFINFPVATMTEDNRYIYYGTYRHKLMQFDKKLRVNEVLANTDDYDMQAILKLSDTIYVACAEGLLKYSHNNLQLYKPGDNSEDNSLLSIAFNQKHGLLLGSQNGKLYQYDRSSSTFSVLYKDPFASSIASILFDDHDKIWLNTFRGIVAFDPITQKTERYSESDGMSFYETNRYSALKTKDGHFLVGTLKGLNYFHPDEVEKSRIDDVSLRLIAVNYAGKNNKTIYLNAPKDVEKISELSIPPNNKNLNLTFGLFGIINHENISYRYRLNEQPWTNLQNKTQINFFNLPSGSYSLQIEAHNSLDETIGNSLNVKITAKPFFYETAWFYTLAILGLLGVFTLIYFEKRKKYLLKEKYAAQIIRAQEADRVRISKELHDNIGQKLLLIKMNAKLKNNCSDEEMTLLDTTLNEVRTISHQMHPFQFEKLGLKKSLINMIDHFQRNSAVFYSCELDNIDDFLSKDKELFVFRILQECVTNVEKHAQAQACVLTAKRNKNKLIFKLKDNGKGFLVAQKQSSSGLGLKSLQERAQYIRADFQLKSKPGEGTTILLKIEKS